MRRPVKSSLNVNRVPAAREAVKIIPIKTSVVRIEFFCKMPNQECAEKKRGRPSVLLTSDL